MMNDGFDYTNFIAYLKEQLDDSSHNEVNGFEVFVDYYLDYPPDSLDEGDSDFFREEIDRLVQDEIFSVQKTLIENESAWLVIDGEKWRLKLEDIEEIDDSKTELLKKITNEEASFFELSILEIDEQKREQLINFYKQKVNKCGTEQEKYEVLKLIVESYQYAVDEDQDYVSYFSEIGGLGKQLQECNSYKYEYEASACQFELAIETAKFCKEDNSIILSLTKSLRIQYDLCRNEDDAAVAFIRENNLKAKVDGRKRVKIVLGVLGAVSDYCQNPKKVAAYAFVLIAISAIIYGFSGITPTGGEVQTFLSSDHSTLRVLCESLYFSVVTFTTLGYGDFSPGNDFSRLVAGIEALGGLFFTSLFLVTLVRKYGR
jgi:hypothetical protein